MNKSRKSRQLIEVLKWIVIFQGSNQYRSDRDFRRGTSNRLWAESQVLLELDCSIVVPLDYVPDPAMKNKYGQQ